MPKLDMLIFLNSYSDRQSTNNPEHNGVKWTRQINAMPITDAGTTMPFILAAGETKVLFDTTRTLAQDGTTQYTLVNGPVVNSYTLTWTGGTAPNFRTPRVTGADATTQVVVTANGPVLTFSSTGGTDASFTGVVPGMISTVVITANTAGTAGNSVILTGNGTSNLNTLISNWNTANPSNQVTLTTGNGLQVPNSPTAASFTGTILGTSTAVTITANNAGSIGNSFTLTGDGTSTINTLISNWNTANPSNQVTLTSGDGTQIPLGGVYASYTGVGNPTGISTPVTITALIAGIDGNAIELIGDGASTINTLIANWNIINPSNPIALTAGNGGQITAFGSLYTLTGGINPATASLSGGVSTSIILSGGTSSTPFNLISGGVVVGDQVFIGNLFNSQNQGLWKIIAVTATSFSVANAVGVPQGPITLGAGFASQIQIFSALGVQVNDSLVISSGFSQVAWGTYLITGVTAESLTFYTNTILPVGIPVTVEIDIYESAKLMVYLEADQNCEITINGTDAGNVEPWIILNGTRPGQYLRKSTIYSMSVTNNSTSGANLVFASVE